MQCTDLAPSSLVDAASKRGNAVMEFLEDFSRRQLDKIGFFHSGAEPASHGLRPETGGPPTHRTTPLLQKGVIRTNCIDCIE